MPSRRHLLAGAAALAAAPAAAPLARAAAPPMGRQVASLYRVRIGEIEVTAVGDGTINLPPAVFGDANLAEARRLLAEARLPAEGAVPCAVNTFLVNAGGRLALIDTGSGEALGPTMGQMPANLAAMAITPALIDTILLTHLHRDHAGGLCDRAGRALFPAAELVIPKAEAAFWFEEANIGRVPQGSRGGFAYARQVASAYQGRIRRLPGGASPVAGVTSIDAFGHTPGHTLYRIASGADQLLVFGDMVHIPALQSRHPEWGISFDVDPAAAVATRRRVLDMCAADRLPVAGMHMDFPGLGQVRREAGGYTLLPAPWRPIL
ncbi:MBL fold metallo-hydrolase [Dankookia rubra]|nr:MBL fold metallo-hydrolase [Dankookia rubra]